MANFVITITNGLRLFGPGNSTKWGQSNGFAFTMTWGTSRWGEDGTLVSMFEKVIQNSQPIDQTISNSVGYNRTIAVGSFTAEFSSSSQAIFNGSGWNYVFTSDTSAGSERDFASWTAGAGSTASFTCLSAGTTSWGEA